MADFRKFARAKTYQRHKPGVMNKLEKRYSEHLNLLKAAGEVHEWWFEAFKFKLTEDRCTFTPDFLVQLPDGTLEVRETKGWFREDAKLKLKLMAALFPFRCFLVKEVKKSWVIKEF